MTAKPANGLHLMMIDEGTTGVVLMRGAAGGLDRSVLLVTPPPIAVYPGRRE